MKLCQEMHAAVGENQLNIPQTQAVYLQLVDDVGGFI